MINKQRVKSKAAGRINIIGEHTDYNDGFVLPAATDKNTIFDIQLNHTASRVNVTAANLNEHFSFDLANFDPLPSGWQNYVMGVVYELQKMGAQLKGFDAHFEGNVPIGGGMSSSAALECSLAVGLNELFDLNFGKWEIIRAAQRTEHEFVGIKCGIMDQFASMMGKKDQVMLLDCRSLDFEYLPFDLVNYELLLLNTNISHSLASSEYNTRREACEQGVQILQTQFPKITALRDVDMTMLEMLRDQLPGKVYQRCKHVIKENERVLLAKQVLASKEIHKLGHLMNESHKSLQYDYEVSCPELDFLVDLALEENHVLGSRMMGGGFGGCTINIVEKSKTNIFVEKAAQRYKAHFGTDLTPYAVAIDDGALIMN